MHQAIAENPFHFKLHLLFRRITTSTLPSSVMTSRPGKAKDATKPKAKPKRAFVARKSPKWPPRAQDIPPVVDDGNKPPFGYVELIAMAIIRSRAGHLKHEAICRWIHDNFKYFRQTTFNGCYHNQSIWDKPRRKGDEDFDWMDIVRDTLRCYHSMVIRKSYPMRGEPKDGFSYKIRPGLRGAALQASERPQQTAFPFILLPAELRNNIYRLALTCDSVTVVPENSEPPCLSSSLYHHSSLSKSGRAFTIGVSSMTRSSWMPPLLMLGLLGVCRQIYQEAEAFFYFENRFQFHSPEMLGTFLRGIGPRRRRWIREITLPYPDTKHPLPFEMLASCGRLSILHVHLCMTDCPSGPNHPYPGLLQLGSIRGLTALKCEGVNPWRKEIENYLKIYVLLPRAGAAKVTT